MFWKKGQEPPPSQRIGSKRTRDEEVEVVEAPLPDDDEQALAAMETVASLLRSMGKHAFDLDEVPREDAAETFEKWAMRLLVGDVPSTRDGDSERPSERPRGIRRDWGGVRRFFERHRQHEHDYVVTGMDNLRQAVRVFIQCTTGSFRAEHESEALVSAELDNLGRALAVNDHAQIRAAAERTAQTVRGEMEARQTREKKQIVQLEESMNQLRQELTQMKRQARTDGLTQVFNRAALDEHILAVADHAFLSGTEACVVMVDIDWFKGINDNYGHQTGDEVLRQVADTIVREFFRREDFVSRYGGEEFCIVAQHTSFDTTRERAERLRQAVEKLAITAFGKTLHCSVSFGIASLHRGETAQSWLKRADDALYRAKQKGRNRISIAPPEHFGEALGGQGAPLGATLGRSSSVRPPDSPRIVVKVKPTAYSVDDTPPSTGRALRELQAERSKSPGSNRDPVRSAKKEEPRQSVRVKRERTARSSESSAPPSSGLVRDAQPRKIGRKNARASAQTSGRPPEGGKIPRQVPANENAEGQRQKTRTGAAARRAPREAGAASPIAALLGPSTRR